MKGVQSTGKERGREQINRKTGTKGEKARTRKQTWGMKETNVKE